MYGFLTGMDMVNEALEVAMDGKDTNDWTPVSVNVAPATLTILSKQVRSKIRFTFLFIYFFIL